jgi:hypothetical protein
VNSDEVLEVGDRRVVARHALVERLHAHACGRLPSRSLALRRVHHRRRELLAAAPRRRAGSSRDDSGWRVPKPASVRTSRSRRAIARE